MDKRENKNGPSCGSADTRKHMAGTVEERSVIYFAKFLSNAQFPSLFSFDYFVAHLAIVQKFAVYRCQVFITVNCQINGSRVDFRIDRRGKRDWNENIVDRLYLNQCLVFSIVIALSLIASNHRHRLRSDLFQYDYLLSVFLKIRLRKIIIFISDINIYSREIFSAMNNKCINVESEILPTFMKNSFA